MSLEVRTMRSATSYFNCTLFKKNLTRFWPIWALYGVIWMVSLPLSMLTSGRQSDLEHLARRWVLDAAATEGLILAVPFGLLAAMAVFSYLYNHRSAGLMHALPIRREGLFLTNYLSGLAFLLLPLCVVFVSTLAAEALMGVVYLPALLTWFCLQILYVLFFYSFAVFCAMFTGNLLALPAFYGILNLLVYVMTYLISALFQLFLFGFYSANRMDAFAAWLTPALMLGRTVNVSRVELEPNVSSYSLGGIPTALLYAAVGLVLAALALVLYRRKQIESAGDVVSVAWVRPVFKYGCAFCSALSLGIFLYSIFIWDLPRSPWALLIFMLLCGAVGYFAAEMLLQKSFRVFRKWKGCVVFSLVLVAATCALTFDVTGFERRVPETGAVQSVLLRSNSTMPYDSGNQHSFLFSDPEHIALVTGLHQSIVDSRVTLRLMDKETLYEPLPLPDGTTTQVQTQGILFLHLDYSMRDGSIVTRRYDIPVTDALLADPSSPAARLDALLNRPEQLVQAYGGELGLNDPREGVHLVNTTLSYYDTAHMSYTTDTLPQDSGLPEALLSAVRADLEAGRIGRRYLIENEARLTNCYYNDLTFTFYVPDRYFDREEGAYSNTYDVTVTLQTTAAETLKVLQEYGAVNETKLLVPVANVDHPVSDGDPAVKETTIIPVQ